MKRKLIVLCCDDEFYNDDGIIRHSNQAIPLTFQYFWSSVLSALVCALMNLLKMLYMENSVG